MATSTFRHRELNAINVDATHSHTLAACSPHQVPRISLSPKKNDEDIGAHNNDDEHAPPTYIQTCTLSGLVF
eukprot:3479715-Amphidinium_carterae.1